MGGGGGGGWGGREGIRRQERLSAWARLYERRQLVVKDSNDVMIKLVCLCQCIGEVMRVFMHKGDDIT